MPDQCPRKVATPSAAGVATRGLLSSRLQRASRIGPAHLAEHEGPVSALVRSHARDVTGRGVRSETLGCRDLILWHPAHVGTDLATASSHSLCRARRRSVAGSHALDLFTIQFLPAREGPEPGIPWQVPRRASPRFPRQETRILRCLFATGGCKEHQPIPANLVCAELGRVFETTVWRAGSCPAVPGSLYPSRRYLQPSHCFGYHI